MNKGKDILNPDVTLISMTGVLVSRETKNIIDQPIIVRFKDGVVVEYPEPVLKSDIVLDDVKFFLKDKFGFNFSLHNIVIRITEILVETSVYENDPIFGVRKDSRIVSVSMTMVPDYSIIEFSNEAE